MRLVRVALYGDVSVWKEGPVDPAVVFISIRKGIRCQIFFLPIKGRHPPTYLPRTYLEFPFWCTTYLCQSRIGRSSVAIL